MYKSIPHRVRAMSEKYPDNIICYYKDSDNEYLSIKYSDFFSNVYRNAHFLLKHCNIKKRDHVGLISENRKEWLEFDLAILSLGAIDVPRGTETSINEISFILEHAEVKGVIFEKLSSYVALRKLNPKFCKELKFAIFLDSPPRKEFSKFRGPTKFHTYKEIAAKPVNEKEITNINRKIDQIKPDDLATIIYTSGTTEEPKGACIMHKNFLFQIDRILPERLSLNKNDTFLSVLPIWHIFEREVNYIVVCIGAALAYSKPIGSIFLEDIKKISPAFLTSVPRIWEGVYTAIKKKIKAGSAMKRFFFSAAVSVGRIFSYSRHLIRGSIPAFNPRSRIFDKILGFLLFVLFYIPNLILDALVFKKIRKLLGAKFKTGISGGGALLPSVDTFFQAAKIKVLNGYGLTETAPVIAVRNEYTPEYTGAGKFLRDILYKVQNQNGNIVPLGEKGELHIKSEQVMKGYYKNSKSTKEAISSDGWLNTGDLVQVSDEGDINILGRSKNTIVLNNGKNIEPEYIESILCQSNYILNAMVIGQDQKFLSALIVPDLELYKDYAKQLNLIFNRVSDLCNEEQIITHTRAEINKYSQSLNSYEKVVRFLLIPKEFKAGSELTQTLKLKRFQLHEKYKREIKKLLR